MCIRAGASTRAEIAALLKMQHSTVQRATDRLEADGLIVIHAPPHPAPHRIRAVADLAARSIPQSSGDDDIPW